jgi:hypothetical protein
VARSAGGLKILLWALVALLALAVVLPFVVKSRHGRPLMAPEGVHLPKIKVPELPDFPGGDETMTVYRWQDAEGAWHFSDRAPEGVDAERVKVETPTVVPEPPAAPGGEDANDGNADEGPFNGLSGIMRRAEKAGDQLKSRNDALKERMDPAP